MTLSCSDRVPSAGCWVATDIRCCWCFLCRLIEQNRYWCHWSVTGAFSGPCRGALPRPAQLTLQSSVHLAIRLLLFAGLFLIQINIYVKLTVWFQEEICKHGMRELFHGWLYVAVQGGNKQQQGKTVVKLTSLRNIWQLEIFLLKCIHFVNFVFQCLRFKIKKSWKPLTS